MPRWQEAPIEDQAAAPSGQRWQEAPVESQESSNPSFLQRFGRATALAGRSIAEGVADLGTPFANPIAYGSHQEYDPRWDRVTEATGLGGEQMRFPEQGQAFSNALTEAGVPAPEGGVETAVNITGRIGTGMVLGGSMTRSVMERLGLVQPTAVQPLTQREATFRAGQREGLSAPPATVRPDSRIASFVEGAGGKLKTGQMASARNQPVYNRLAARALGLGDGVEITPDLLNSLRNDAQPAYNAIRNVGRIVADADYQKAVNSAARSFKSAADDFPELANDDFLRIAAGMNKPAFNADSAINSMRILRDKASAAFRSGESGLGHAYRQLSDALESVIERHLERSGGQSDLLDAFRAARRLIAKTHTVEDALRANNVDAQALGRMLQRGKPLTDELKLIAEFAQQFPKASRTYLASESMPSYSPIDFWTAGTSLATAGVTGQPQLAIPAAYSIGRPAIRNAMLSPTIQNFLAQRGAARGGQANRLIGGVPAATNALLAE